ncbi:DUF1285 domain-containing protein [Anaeromyxobacter sp. PSR-1]|uniref:DUF1285 domain-containing protein n=1 Tax=Anaeromyxobacter sp. PSR-1 TaxID=1300915 RepID=UPI0005E75420|nr:DUF1285 domain-containing protein [Anaeromyxobacter sp. PSR-1]GAO03075.1 hypothetical protein PSR1_01958 [Anaeromyxobacter sp. PSR-1]
MSEGAPDPAALELLRSRSGLSIDAEGRFLHRGEPITHARTLEVLWRSLARTPDGRYEVAIGRERAYVQVDEAPYAVRGATEDPGGGAPLLHLSDGTAEPLDPATLSLGADGVLRCAVKGGAHRARFTRAGHVSLGLMLREDPPGSGDYALFVNGTRWPVTVS